MSWADICNDFLSNLIGKDVFSTVRDRIYEEEKMQSLYPENIQKIASELLEIIEKYYPGLTKKTFDNFGQPNREGSPAQERAEMCIYIELVKGGAFDATV